MNVRRVITASHYISKHCKHFGDGNTFENTNSTKKTNVLATSDHTLPMSIYSRSLVHLRKQLSNKCKKTHICPDIPTIMERLTLESLCDFCWHHVLFLSQIYLLCLPKACLGPHWKSMPIRPSQFKCTWYAIILLTPLIPEAAKFIIVRWTFERMNLWNLTYALICNIHCSGWIYAQ